MNYQNDSIKTYPVPINNMYIFRRHEKSEQRIDYGVVLTRNHQNELCVYSGSILRRLPQFLKESEDFRNYIEDSLHNAKVRDRNVYLVEIVKENGEPNEDYNKMTVLNQEGINSLNNTIHNYFDWAWFDQEISAADEMTIINAIQHAYDILDDMRDRIANDNPNINRNINSKFDPYMMAQAIDNPTAFVSSIKRWKNDAYKLVDEVRYVYNRLFDENKDSKFILKLIYTRSGVDKVPAAKLLRRMLKRYNIDENTIPVNYINSFAINAEYRKKFEEAAHELFDSYKSQLATKRIRTNNILL